MKLREIDEFDALTRLDLNVFLERVFAELNLSTRYSDNFHIGLVCGELEAVRLGHTRRLAIALPPRSLKSIMTSVAFAAWLLGKDPTIQIICASYGQLLADSLGRDCRQVMNSGWYRRLFPGTILAADKQAVGALETTMGGTRRATSVGGSLTGYGADVIIVDDPMKPEEAASDAERKKANEWAQHSLLTRLNDKKRGAIILTMQRLHEVDMIGHMDSLFKPDLRLISFPAIAQRDETHRVVTPFGVRQHHRRADEALHHEREPLTVLEEIRRALGSSFFAAQYLQMPAPPGGAIVKPEWFSRYDPGARPKFERIIQSWDTASRSTELADFSVCTTWGKKGEQYYLMHVMRKKLEYPQLKRAVIEQAKLFNPTVVLVEDASSGIALIQDLKIDKFYKLKAVKPRGDKVMRLETSTSVIEAGQVFIPHAAVWLDDYLYELSMFPATRYDDQVDSTTQALSYFRDDSGRDLDSFIEIMRQRALKACE